MVLDLATVDTKEVDKKASDAIVAAEALKIVDDDSYSSAAEKLKALKAISKEVDATFDPVIKANNAAHKAAIAAKKKHSEPLVQAEGIIKRKLGRYASEKEKEAEEERKRLEAEARRAEEEERLKAAAAAEDEGASEAEVEDILDTPAPVAAPVDVPKATPVVAGVSMRTTWKFRITDEKKIPREYLITDTVKIGQVVRAMKGATNIEGIEAYPDKTVSAGSR